MTDDDEAPQSPYDPRPIQIALQAIPHAHDIVIHNLRLMAGARPPYQNFIHMPPMTRGIWYAAADMLAEEEEKKQKE